MTSVKRTLRPENIAPAERGGNAGEYDLPGLPRYALLPGDPGRVSLMASQWRKGSVEEHTLRRGYRGAIGDYNGARISAFSTGIGGASAEGVLTRLAGAGVDTVIRVGTTGAVQEHIEVGDLIINDASVRMDGTSNLYVRPEFPAVASFEVTTALVEAAEDLGVRYHVGTGYTSASFFTGQFRTTLGGYRPTRLDSEFEDMRQAGVTNFEMEGATIMTLSRIFGLRAGMCAAVVAHRITGEWDTTAKGEANACLVAAEAVRLLTAWDEARQKAGRRHFSPGALAADPR
ncbi:nucleoside phosphorylase [Pseudonocardia acaciae]|uniref:nucleoside phosphorylase n=1 Tax=Pseudonocardia acaciae TaxID=551276 RepID=UPI000A023D30|nr:nucleoside phosphorylase [Pseudonocardia acaciae]